MCLHLCVLCVVGLFDSCVILGIRIATMNKSIRYFESFDHGGSGHGENVLLLFIVATCMLSINQVVCMYTVLIRKKKKMFTNCCNN